MFNSTLVAPNGGPSREEVLIDAALVMIQQSYPGAVGLSRRVSHPSPGTIPSRIQLLNIQTFWSFLQHSE